MTGIVTLVNASGQLPFMTLKKAAIPPPLPGFVDGPRITFGIWAKDTINFQSDFLPPNSSTRPPVGQGDDSDGVRSCACCMLEELAW